MTMYERVQAYTMVNYETIEILERAVREVVKGVISGAMAECGVCKGGCVMAMAYTLMELGQVRDLYLFDTFSGMTKPEEVDGVQSNQLWDTEENWCYASFAEVQANLATTGYPPEKLHYIVGPVEKTLPEFAPENLALVRLDTDWYSSTKHELVHLYPRLSLGGVLIIDDYNAWEGCKKAVDEYFDGLGVVVDKVPDAGHQVIVRK